MNLLKAILRYEIKVFKKYDTYALFLKHKIIYYYIEINIKEECWGDKNDI